MEKEEEERTVDEDKNTEEEESLTYSIEKEETEWIKVRCLIKFK